MKFDNNRLSLRYREKNHKYVMFMAYFEGGSELIL